jgi:catechol 2,3-dioxygenase-like lactoylglutathione lyase family enzyme
VSELDHSVIAVTDWERSNAFYVDLLGAELVRPGNSHHCFRWEGPIDTAVEHLERHGVEVELGPVARAGARGEGTSVYFRDPDGSLLELISYLPVVR